MGSLKSWHYQTRKCKEFQNRKAEENPYISIIIRTESLREDKYRKCVLNKAFQCICEERKDKSPSKWFQKWN